MAAGVPNSPVMDRLLVVAKAARAAGRAALVAICEASLEASTRVEAIVTDGKSMQENAKIGSGGMTR